MWTVELEPEVEQWMDRLSVTEFATTLPHVERPAERGNQLRMPASRSLGDGLFELRFDLTRVAWRTWRGTHTGPLTTPTGEIPASGKSQATPGAWIFDYEGDSLLESRHYFDMLTFLQQIGAA